MNDSPILSSYTMFVYKDGSVELVRSFEGNMFTQARSDAPANVFNVSVYEDGSLEMVERLSEFSPPESQASEAPVIRENGDPSERIARILAVMEYVRVHNREFRSAATALDRGIAFVAEEDKVSTSVITDALCRQTGKNIDFWRTQVTYWLNSRSFSPISFHLKKYCLKSPEDENAIDEFAAKASQI